MTDIPISLDDSLAVSLIHYLQADDALADLIMSDVYDQADQSSRIALAAQSSGVAVTVSIQAPENPYADDRTRRAGRMYLPLMLSIIAVPNMAMPAPHVTVMSYIRAVQARLIKRMGKWQYNDCAENAPAITGIYDLDLSQMPDLQDMIGRSIVLSCPVNY